MVSIVRTGLASGWSNAAMLLLTALAAAACSTGYPEVRAKAVSGNATTDRVGTYHEQAIRHFSNGQYGLAIRNFSLSLSGNPYSIEDLNGLAASYDLLRRFDVASKFYQRALRIDPYAPQTFYNFGYSFYLQRKYNIAAVFFVMAVRSSQVAPEAAGPRVREVAGNVRSPAEIALRGTCALIATRPAAARATDHAASSIASRKLGILRISRRERELVTSEELPIPPETSHGSDGISALASELSESRREMATGFGRAEALDDVCAGRPGVLERRRIQELRSVDTGMSNVSPSVLAMTDPGEDNDGAVDTLIEMDMAPQLFEFGPTIMSGARSLDEYE